ncbi:AAA family ATPase (plasmid) [Citricoccus nitrophenolicus]
MALATRSKKSSASTNLKSTPMMRVLAAAVTANVPAVLEGDPGQGKTAKIENAAAQWGRHCETIVGSSREATDFLGVMAEREDGTIGYHPFQWTKRLNDAPKKGLKGLLFLDELNRSSDLTMNAMLRVLQERTVGDTKLGDHVSIIAAMNPPESNAEVNELSAAAANRMLHLKWVFDSKSWMENLATDFAEASHEDLSMMTHDQPKDRMIRVGAEIAGFHNHDRTQLNPGVPDDPTQASRGWASPRSWHNLARVASHLMPGDDEALAIAAEGLVGEGAANAYMAWRATADLIDPMVAMADPSAVDWSTRSDRLFVLVTSVGTIGLSDQDHWADAMAVMVACAANGKPDVAMPSATKLLNKIPSGASMPEGVRQHFGDLLNRTSRGVRTA